MAKIEYYALVLKPEQSTQLLQKFEHLIPAEWKTFAHHMTILHMSRPNPEIEAWAQEHLGDVSSVEAIEVGISDDAIAVKVAGDVPSANSLKHITLAVPPKGKPVNSNYIKDWTPITPITIIGNIEAISH